MNFCFEQEEVKVKVIKFVYVHVVEISIAFIAENYIYPRKNIKEDITRKAVYHFSFSCKENWNLKRKGRKSLWTVKPVKICIEIVHSSVGFYFWNKVQKRNIRCGKKYVREAKVTFYFFFLSPKLGQNKKGTDCLPRIPLQAPGRHTHSFANHTIFHSCLIKQLFIIMIDTERFRAVILTIFSLDFDSKAFESRIVCAV